MNDRGVQRMERKELERRTEPGRMEDRCESVCVDEKRKAKSYEKEQV
jgi:hypothetical protein